MAGNARPADNVELYTIKLPQQQGILGLFLENTKSTHNGNANSNVSKKRKVPSSDGDKKVLYVAPDSPALEICHRIRTMVDKYGSKNDRRRSKGLSIEWTTLDDLIDIDKDMNDLHGNGGQDIFNRQILKFVLVHGIKEGDLIHCIHSVREVVHAEDAGMGVAQMRAWLSDESNYPLCLTFKRTVPPSSDIKIDAKPTSTVPYAQPDILPQFYRDELVVTPTGPGKVYNVRIDRHTEGDHLVHPILIYTIRHTSHISYVPSTDIQSIQHPDIQREILKRLNYTSFYSVNSNS